MAFQVDTFREMTLKKKSLIVEEEKQFSFNSYIQRWHAYMEIRTPKIEDDNLYLKCWNGSEHDKYAVAVAVMIGGQTGTHIPKNFSEILKLFSLFQAL